MNAEELDKEVLTEILYTLHILQYEGFTGNDHLIIIHRGKEFFESYGEAYTQRRVK